MPGSATEKVIGYLVPEFPGQTHIFLWREYQALTDLDVSVKLVSTRRPPEKVRSHDWSVHAESITSYLLPLSLSDLGMMAGVLLRAGPSGWLSCARAVLNARMPAKQKLGLVALIPFAAKLAGLAGRQNWQHVHVASCGNTANIAMFSTLLKGPTYSLALLGPRLSTYGPNQEQKWKHAAFGLFQSQQLYEEAKGKIPEALPTLVDVAPVGVNLEVMKREAPYEIWQPSQVARIYCCGRLNQIKGHTYLIETVRILRDKGLDATLTIAGEDEQGGAGYRKVIEAFIEENDMSDHVELLGAVSERRNRQGYAEAHIYAMGSLDEAAGAVAAMEAMAMEVPVVMTNVGATPELIEDGVDAMLVPPKQPAVQAEVIYEILNNPELARRLGRAGREKIARKFSHRRSAEKINEFLERIQM